MPEMLSILSQIAGGKEQEKEKKRTKKRTLLIELAPEFVHYGQAENWYER